jgi:hypothetical protein
MGYQNFSLILGKMYSLERVIKINEKHDMLTAVKVLNKMVATFLNSSFKK